MNGSAPDAGVVCPADSLERLAAVQGFVFDMDGTLVLGDQHNHGLAALSGAVAITAWLRRHRIPFVVFTNGTTRSPSAYARSLGQAGIDIDEAAMLTPASSAADLFTRLKFQRVMVLGGEGSCEPLRRAGLEILAPAGKERVDAVFIGWYREFTMDGLEAACHAVWNGARVYSASQALYFATASGKALGTSRAIAAMIREMTGCRIHVIGKPSLDALKCAGRRLGVNLNRLAVVGDDPSLEVPMAHRGRALAIAVHTGLGKPDSFAHLPAERMPHITVPGVAELLELCARAGIGASFDS